MKVYFVEWSLDASVMVLINTWMCEGLASSINVLKKAWKRYQKTGLTQ